MQINGKVKLWLLSTAIVLAALVLVSCGDPAAESQRMLETAKAYIADNSPREAALELKNALQADPENGEARYLLGLLNIDFGDTAGAEKEFRRAMQAGWSEEETQLGLARAVVNGNDFKKMIEEIEIKDQYSTTTRANLYGLRASALAGLGLRAQADEAFAEGAALDADSVQIRKASIQLKLLDADNQAARTESTEALGAYPDNRELLLLSGIVALKEQDVAAGVEANQRVIELEPSNITTIYGRQARLRLTRLQIIDKQFDQAAATLKPLFRQYANDPEANYLGGMLAFGKGNYDLAEERLLNVLKVTPDHLQTQLLFGTVSYQQKNYEQAAHHLSRYISAVPENLGARKLLGRTYMQLGQSDKAQEVFRPALSGRTDDVELLALVGLNDLRGGDMASGIENLEKAVESAPDNAGLRKELAKAYIQSGETEQAINELNTILSEANGQGNTQALLVFAQLKAGQPEQAIDTALGMLADNPDNPAVLTLVGNVFVATGDQVEARNYYDKALKLDPGHPQASVSLARLHELEGNLAEAATVYKGLVDAEVKSTIPLLALARLANKQNDKQGMYGWLEKARTQFPKQLPPRLVLAEALMRDRRLKDAEPVVKEAMEIAPNNARVLGQWGRLLVADQRYNEAQKTLTELVELAPDSTFSRVLLAEIHLKLGQVEEAKNELTIAIEKNPDSIPALALLARSEIKAGQYQQALQHAFKIQQLTPENPVGFELVGDSSFEQKQYGDAVSAYREAWVRGQSSGVAIKQSIASSMMGNPDLGLEVLKSWLSEHEDDVRAQEFYGTALQDNGNNAEAIQAYEKVLKLQPDNLVALNNLAWLYSLDQDPKALTLAEKAYETKPDDPGVKDTYGWILVQQGQPEKGRRLIRQALDKLQDNAEVRFHHAVAMIKTGEKEEGIKRLQDLLAEGKEFQGKDEAERLISTP